MKLLLFLFLFTLSSFAQVTVKHTNYTVTIDTLKHYPICVSWNQNKEMENCDKLIRVNTFATDSLLPKWTDIDKYYENSGLIDRGHMMPAEINLCQGEWVEHQCFLMGNIAAQYRGLNRGPWKSIETISYNWAKLYDLEIWAGNIGEIGKLGIVSIPKYCWKIIYIVQKNQFYAYLFLNSNDKKANRDPQSTVENIESLTGLTFVP